MLPSLRVCASRGVRAFSAESVKSIGVVGAGQMGSGIAIVSAANAGRNVILMDQSSAQLDGALKLAEKTLQRNVQKGRMQQEDAQAALARITTSDSLGALTDVDMVVEAATENVDLKLQIFKKLDEITRPGIVLASNTSSISITKIAGATQRPEKVIGMHFMNPVPVMKLVEVIPGMATSEQTLKQTLELAEQMGKTTTLAQDMPGFIANRLLMPYINEAFYTLQEGVATPEDIDTTMKLGTNVPMGPLTLGDFIGLDTCLAIMQVLHSQLGDAKYRPCPLLVNYVNAGWLGKKAGRGVYNYSASPQ
ncbi:MAG: hypothetical protein MHM6MM_001012 [Cercozoa sp. M6MM]